MSYTIDRSLRDTGIDAAKHRVRPTSSEAGQVNDMLAGAVKNA